MNSATNRLTVVSYAVYRIPRIRDALVAAARPYDQLCLDIGRYRVSISGGSHKRCVSGGAHQRIAWLSLMKGRRKLDRSLPYDSVTTEAKAKPPANSAISPTRHQPVRVGGQTPDENAVSSDGHADQFTAQGQASGTFRIRVLLRCIGDEPFAPCSRARCKAWYIHSQAEQPTPPH